MMVSRAQMEAVRHPDCLWSATAMANAIEVRFPGGGDVDLANLINAWLGDPTLPHGTLAQCAILASNLARIQVRGVWLHPKDKLREVLAAIAPPPP